ncbi:DUF2236 domain-containing protein [Nocardia sp. ET3-3]|uniref:DUF2236 domain-containing protein n=1 Tax=Nocardia terrae TaxID=2675851 RepID=A0A7K1US57_9NOCA|nr:oxygenase MpaB family protein [Nocardia terrae]MVU77183.1 DUF2236 domain-containing protein [Nocardia terrae]
MSSQTRTNQSSPRGIDTADRPSNPPTSAPDAADAVAVLTAIRSRVTPPMGAAMLNNLIYAVGFMRISGSVEGADAVDRAGKGKIHRHGDRRADDTTNYFLDWMTHGAHSEHGRADIAKVVRMHDHFGQSYSMSNETFVHAIALFTVLFDEIFQVLGLDIFTEEEKAAQVAHWYAIGEQMRVRDMPDSWAGMQRALDVYEADPQWYRPTEAGYRCAEALIEQFDNRWLPRPLHPLGRSIVLSLLPDRALWAVGERKPPAVVVVVVRRGLRALMTAQLRLVPRLRRLRRGGPRHVDA